MSIEVKICGIRTLEALDAAVDYGAAYVGFVHYPPSPRHVSIHDMVSLARALPDSVRSIVVTVNAADNDVEELLQRFPSPPIIQLHGSESAARIMQLREKFPALSFIKAIPIASAYDIKSTESFMLYCDMLLFDAKPPENAALPGGNGIAFDWTLLNTDYCKKLQEELPCFLSGGLTPQNVQTAIRLSGMRRVDVSSGVESAPGVKDVRLIQHFITAAKSA